MSRKAIPNSIKQQVLHEAGYRCSNPTCRTIITLDIHHLQQVSEGGGNTVENLLVLCPNCHALHHRGTISIESLKTWKFLLISLNEGFNKNSIDVLLAMPEIKELSVSGDGFLHIACLITGGYLSISTQIFGSGGRGQSFFTLRLTDKGKLFVEAWKDGNQSAAINAGFELNDSNPEPQND